MITVTVEGDTLRVERKGHAGLIAIPETATQFYLKGAGATIEFTRADNGNVTHLTLLQDNRYLKAVRTKPPASSPAPKPAGQPVSAGSSAKGAKP